MGGLEFGAGTEQYSNLSSYATCLDFIRYRGNTNCTYIFDAPLMFFYSSIVVTGAINSAMSVIVFFQAKYSKRLISKLLRIFYVCNVAVVISLFLNLIFNHCIPKMNSWFVFILKRFSTFAFISAYKCSSGVLAYIAFLKCVNLKCPFFIAYSKHAYTLSYLVLMFIFTSAFGLSFRNIFVKFDMSASDELVPNIIFYWITILAIIISNCFWVYSETYRNKRDLSTTSRENRKLFKFGLFSSGLYVTTTLPVTVFYLLKMPGDWEPTCRSCHKVLHLGNYLIYTMYCGCLYHNVIYICISKVYRKDLAWGIKRVLQCQGVGNPKSGPSSRSDLRSGT